MTTTPNMPSRHLIAIVAMCLVTIIFSFHYVIAKEVLTAVSPPALAGLRGILGGGSLLLYLRLRGIDVKITSLKVGVRILAIAALSFGFNQILFMRGIAQSSAADAAMINTSIPFVGAILAAAAGIEYLSKLKIVGLLLGAFAINSYLLYLNEINLQANLLGNILIAFNVLMFATGMFLIKILLRQIRGEVVMAWVLLFGGTGLSLYAGSEVVTAVEWSMSGTRPILFIIFEVLVSTSLAYALNVFALKHLTLTLTTSFVFLQVPLAAALAWVMSGTKPSWALIPTAALIATGCYLIAYEKSRGTSSKWES